MRKSSPIGTASYAGGGGVAAAQQMGSPVPNLATQGSSQHRPRVQHRPGPVQRPAKGGSAAEQKKHRPGRSGWEAHPKFGSPVGTRGPRTAVLYDLPETIVNVVPQYRGFKCTVVQDELIIVDPGTRHRSRSSPA
jgi:hypothetical protein